jgi:hypothetical protein
VRNAHVRPEPGIAAPSAASGTSLPTSHTVRVRFDWRAHERGAGCIEATRRAVLAAQRSGAPVAVTVCDWRLPDGLEPASSAFARRLAHAAGALAAALAPIAGAAPLYTPINEIAFLAYALADTSLLRPRRRSGGTRDDVERHLVRAAVAACEAIRAADPRARFLHVEPLTLDDAGVDVRACRALVRTCDRLSGRREPELGGDDRFAGTIGLALYAGGAATSNADGARMDAHVAEFAAALAQHHGHPATIIERHTTDFAWTRSSSSPTCGGISCTSARSTSCHGSRGTGASCTSRSPCSTPAIRGPSCAHPSPA